MDNYNNTPWYTQEAEEIQRAADAAFCKAKKAGKKQIQKPAIVGKEIEDQLLKDLCKLCPEFAAFIGQAGKTWQKFTKNIKLTTVGCFHNPQSTVAGAYNPNKKILMIKKGAKEPLKVILHEIGHAVYEGLSLTKKGFFETAVLHDYKVMDTKGGFLNCQRRVLADNIIIRVVGDTLYISVETDWGGVLPISNHRCYIAADIYSIIKQQPLAVNQQMIAVHSPKYCNGSLQLAADEAFAECFANYFLNITDQILISNTMSAFKTLIKKF